MAIGMIGPMLAGGLWKAALEPVGAEPIDLHALALEHAETVTRGLLLHSGQGDAT